MTIVRTEPASRTFTGQNDVLTGLRDKLAELMEVTPEEIEVDQPLMSIGADSLVLMEAITFLEQRYKIKLKASQVIEELDTLERLAVHIERHRNDIGAAAGPVDGSAATMPVPATTAPIQTLQEAALPEYDDVVPRAAESEPSAFVTWFPQASAVSGNGLTSDPDPHLVEEFSRHLAGSKLYADRYRPTHADPRGAAFFRRATKEVTVPMIMSRAAGSRIWDIDGNEYLDMTMGFGSLLFGHSHDAVERALARQLRTGIGVGPVSFLAGPLSEEICDLTGQDRVMFVSSGTEAVMLAVRLARFATGRRRVAIFRGSYHGWWDGTLVSPGDGRGSALAAAGGTLGDPRADVLLLPWGDPSALEMLEEHADTLGAILVEPVQSRRPECQPAELVAALRHFADRHGVPLIFDEMITGFRVRAGGAAEMYGVRPDLVTFDKALGGGLPLGCVAGRSDLLDALDGGAWRYGDASAPQADTTFGAGTFAKHPLSLAAAWAVIQDIRRLGPELYDQLERRSARLQEEVNGVFADHALDVELVRCGSLFRFSAKRNLDAFFAALIRHGCYLWEGRSMFLSFAHDDDDVSRFIEICTQALDTIGHPRVDASLLKTQLRSYPAPVGVPTASEGGVIAPVVELPLTPNQRQLSFAYRGNSNAAQGFHNVAVVTFDGPLDIGALERSLGAVANRHDSFRTTFALERDVEILHACTTVGLDVCEVTGTSAGGHQRRVDELVERACTDPFDLEHGPLWRFQLVVESSTRSQMVMACSDLVADGWSLSMVLGEFAELYEAEKIGAVASLDPPGRLTDLRLWLGSDSRRAEMDAALEYWEGILAEVDLTPALPPTHSRGDTSYSKTRAKRVIDAGMMSRVQEFGRAAGITQFSVLLGAFAAFVHQAGGRDDFVIGIPTTGRPVEDLRSVVASLAIPVALRVRVDENTTARELLHDVQRSVFRGVDNATPVEELARKRALATGRLDPIAPIMFNLDPVREVPPFSDGVHLTIGSPERTFGLLPFSAECCPRNDGSMSFSFDAACSMYDADMVEAWADYYVGILGQILDNAETPVVMLMLGTGQ